MQLVNRFVWAFGLSVFSSTLAACGGDHSSEEMSQAIGTIPPTTVVPWTPGPTPPPADPTTGYKSYATTTGGHFKVTDVQLTSLPSNTSYQAFTTLGEQALLLVKVTVSGVSRFELRQRRRTEMQWSTKCSWLDDGRFGTRMMAEGSILYILDSQTPYRSAHFKRWNLDSCAAMTNLAVNWSGTAASFFSFYTPYFSIGSGQIWFYEYIWTNSRAQAYNPLTLSFTQQASSVALGTASFDFSSPFTVGRSTSVGSAEFWGFSSTNSASSQPATLWRRTHNSGRVTAWAYLPDKEFPSLDRYTNTMTNFGVGWMESSGRERVVILVPPRTTSPGTSAEVQVYWFDVTQF